MTFSNEEIKSIDESVKTEDQTEELDDEVIEDDSEENEDEETTSPNDIDLVDIAFKVVTTVVAIGTGYITAKYLASEPKEKEKKEPLIKFQSPIVITRPIKFFKKKEKKETENESTDNSETTNE